MADTPSVVVKHSMSYKGGTQVWSCRYHFNGGEPPDTTHWNTLFDNIVAELKNDIYTFVTITECIGYPAGSDLAAASKSYTQAGLIPLTDRRCPGDCALVIRWTTAARSTKNHPIYLYNYWHGVTNTSADVDTVSNDIKSGAQNFYGKWLSPGFSDGSTYKVRAGPRGATATGASVLTYISHRDFPK